MATKITNIKTLKDMYNFDFYNPTRIFFGKNRLDMLDKHIPSDARVLITFGGGSAQRSGLIDKVKEELGSRKVFIFGGIEPNPRYETLMKAASMIREYNIDFIMAVGGGSVIDGTKFISLVSYYNGDGVDLLKFGKPIPRKMIDKPVPFATVLTLPATGSEMNSGAVISYNHGKYVVSSEMTYPQFSILDPIDTFSLPKIQVANGVIDAFVHVAEQYITYPVDAKIQDRMSEGIMQTLIEIGPANIQEANNYDARANLIWAATMALNGIIAVGVPQDWATHMIGHEITALFGIDHAQTLAIILPALLDVRRDQKRDKIIQFAERVWQINSGSDEEKIDLAIQKTRNFFESLGIKTHLSEYGITSNDLPNILNQLQLHGMTKLSETKDLSIEISKQILDKAL